MLPQLTVAAGEILWDLLETGPRLGGATTNFSVLSARLGNPTALITCLGDDLLGHEAAAQLHTLARDPATQLDLSAIAVSPTLPTGTVGVSLDSQGRPNYEITSPVAWDAIPKTARALELGAQASVFYFGTLAQRLEVSRATVRGLVAQVPPASIRVCDLNLRAPWVSSEVVRWSVAHADLLKVSDEELPAVARLLDAPQLALSELGDDENLTAATTTAAQAILALAPQCRLVAITLGPHGSLLADRSGSFRHLGFPIAVVDTVGAGDAFMAGLVHAYTRTRSLGAISEVANRCGAFVASQQGATPELPQALLDSIIGTLS
jgi:fructokinase